MHKQGGNSLRSWLVFVATAVVLSLIAWLVWSAVTNRDELPLIGGDKPSSSVTVGLTGAPDSLDIRTDASTAVSRALIGNVYETLVTRDENNALQPGLASSWKVSDDGLTYTFTLSSGLTFSNGNVLDSSDVIWSLQQIVKNKYQGSTDLANLKSAVNPNETTVQLTLSKPDPRFLRALSGRAGIVYDSEATIDYATAALGSGPFTVKQFDKGSSITLEHNSRYHGDKTKVGQATLKYYASADALTKAAQNGEVQLAFSDDATLTNAANDGKKPKVETGMSRSKVMLAFNNATDSILSDQQARRAFRFGIDAKGIASSQSDSAGALGGPFTPLDPGYEDLTGMFPYDQGQASSMLAYFYHNYLGTVDLLVPMRYSSLANTIADQLRAISLPVNVETLDSEEAVTQRINDGKYTIALTTTIDDGPVYAGENVYHYQKGEVQQSYANVLAATNDDDYQNRLKAYAKTLSDDAPNDWLYTRKTFIAAANGVSGYPKNMTDELLPLAKVTVG